MYEDMTLENIKQQMVEALGDKVSGAEGSFVNNMLSPVAYQLWLAYQEFNKLLDIMFMDTSDGEYVKRRCDEEGIEWRKGTPATGELTFYGAAGTVIPSGTIVQTEDGLQYTTLDTVSIINQSATVPAESLDDGSRYNVQANTINTMIVNIAGIANLTNAAPFTGGTDEESIDSLKERYYLKKRESPASGNVTDYIKWATEVPGVGNAKIYPLWNGNGTVKVVLVGNNNAPVDNGTITAVEQHIEEVRPIGANVTVIGAQQVPISVSAAVFLDGASLADVKTRFTNQLQAYFSSFDSDKILYNKISAILISLPGVTDFYDLYINDGLANIPIAADSIPCVGTITLTEG